MRLFLAINAPTHVRLGMWVAAAGLRDVAPDVSWTPEERIHTTLKFLGDRPEAEVAPLAQALTNIANSHRPPVMIVRGIGAFPNFRRPRVVWVGVDPEPRLELLHHDVEMACGTLGYELDGRPFRPHFTLGRVRDGCPSDQLRGLRAAVKKVAFADEFIVQSIELMQSTPGPRGPTYSVVATATLRAG